MKAQYFPSSIFMCFLVNQSWSQIESLFVFIKTSTSMPIIKLGSTGVLWLMTFPLEKVKGLADAVLWLNVY